MSPAEDGVKLRRVVLLSRLWLIATLEGEPALARNMEPCQ
jgi:hypothetical protein